MTETDEVAAVMLRRLPRCASMHEALAYVRRQMPDESEVVISNVAWALMRDTHMQEAPR